MKSLLIVQLALLAIFEGEVSSLSNDQLRTPPMGWLSWESFGCRVECNNKRKEWSDCISEDLFIQMADALISKGYKKAGYDRINIDDCWMSKSRDVETGQLQPDPIRFPNGIEYLSNYMHQRGLKLGIYQSYGRTTCMGYPGMLGHEKVDASTFAEWKVDMVKLDGCFTPTTMLSSGYVQFGRHLGQTNQPIAYSCSWPYYQLFASQTFIVPDWKLISQTCNMFRVFHDIHANWLSILATIDFMGDHQVIFRPITGPGSWPDPDMLLIGNPGLSVAQSQVQMSIWCILPAPLFMSNDLLRISHKHQNILQNREAIRINQDGLARPGERVFHNDTFDIWSRQLEGHDVAIVVINRQESSSLSMSLSLTQIIPASTWKNANGKRLQILNVFTGSKDVVDFQLNATPFPIALKPTSAVFLRLSLL